MTAPFFHGTVYMKHIFLFYETVNICYNLTLAPILNGGMYVYYFKTN